jgi:hypothetical protein
LAVVVIIIVRVAPASRWLGRAFFAAGMLAQAALLGEPAPFLAPLLCFEACGFPS